MIYVRLNINTVHFFLLGCNEMWGTPQQKDTKVFPVKQNWASITLVLLEFQSQWHMNLQTKRKTSVLSPEHVIKKVHLNLERKSQIWQKSIQYDFMSTTSTTSSIKYHQYLGMSGTMTMTIYKDTTTLSKNLSGSFARETHRVQKLQDDGGTCKTR